jgi:hypothetical protein
VLLCLNDWRDCKCKHDQCRCEYVVSIFHVIFSFFVLAFVELSSLRTHFRPFTEVMRKSRREVTRELGEQPWIARILRMSQTTLAESLLLKQGTNTSTGLCCYARPID